MNEEINKLIAESTEWESKFYDLQEEYERLNNQLDFIEEQNKYIDKLEEIIKDYKSRCDKAIKFIKEIVIPYGDEWCWDDAYIRDYLEITLNILQNGSDSQ